MNAHQRRMTARRDVRRILAGDNDPEWEISKFVWPYLSRLTDGRQRKHVATVIENAMARAKGDGVDPTMSHCVYYFTLPEKLLVREIMGWPRRHLLYEMPMEDALTLYLLHGWPKDTEEAAAKRMDVFLQDIHKLIQ